MHRLAGVLLLAGLALLFWMTERRAVRDRWDRLERSRVGLAELESQIDAEQRIHGSLENELKDLDETVRATRADLARLESRRAALDPDSRWAHPPSTWPQWNPESPYLWIEKDVLTAIPMKPFTASGTLHPMLAELLAIEAGSARNLAAILDRYMGAVRAWEAAHAVVSREPGSQASGGGERPVSLSVTLPFADSNPIRAALESDLRLELGDSRAALLLHWGRPWLENLFGSPDHPRTYQVTREADETFRVVTETPTGSSSVYGIQDFETYIPEHLHSWFQPLKLRDP